MKLKISLLLLVVLPFFAVADDFLVTQKYYSGDTIVTRQLTLYNSSLSEAFKAELSYCNIGFNTNTFVVNINFSGSTKPPPYAVSNLTAGVLYTRTQNFEYNRAYTFCQCFLTLCQKYHLDIFGLGLLNPSYCYVSSGVIYPREFNFYTFEQNVYQILSAVYLLELTQSISTFQQIQTDVSVLVPLVESNKNINASIATAVAGLNGITNQFQTLLDERLFNYTTDYDIPYIRDNLRDFRALDPQQATGDNYALMTYYYGLRGMDFFNDASGLEAQMVADGFATSISDAGNKLHSNTFRSQILGPAVTVQRQKTDVIAKLKAAGMTSPPSGGSFDDMNLGELETLYEYSYNTPTSTNATLQTKALDELKKINEQTTDALGTLSDIRNEVTGPQEVEVLNWPDDITGLSVAISNAFAEAIANLDVNVSSEVWQVGRDYEEYRNSSSGVSPSYNSYFSDAFFLAPAGPNDGKWWTESQNLLAYIAFYTASNRSISAGILSELATNNELVASSIAAASNNLAAIWGNNPRGWLDDKLDELQEGQTELIQGFNSLTYFQGVENIIDTYYQDVQQLPNGISFDTPFPAQFEINLSSMRGFLELLHAATTLFLIGGWLLCVPYIASWMFEHVNKMFDLFKR